MSQSKNIKLKHNSVYLCGAMEAAEALGAGWRCDITPFIEEELNHKVLDPCQLEDDKLKGFHTNRLPDGITHWHQLKNSKNPSHLARFSRYMRQIIHFDIDIIKDEAGYLITLWDEAAAKGAGTHSEMTVAFLEGLPIFCVNRFRVRKPFYWRLFYNIGKALGFNVVWPTTMPAWLRACCTEVFESMDDLKEYLAREFVEDV